jgi:hypothetical protein
MKKNEEEIKKGEKMEQDYLIQFDGNWSTINEIHKICKIKNILFSAARSLSAKRIL